MQLRIANQMVYGIVNFCNFKFNGTINRKMKNVTPFKIDIDQAVLDDLQHRLKNTRWADEPGERPWQFGTSKTYLEELVDYWTKQYDWRKHETAMNQYPHYIANIEGSNIHFQYIKGKSEQSRPLLLVHGWPDSFYRFHKIIPALTEGEQSFDLIIPSIPGFGFSGSQEKSTTEVADLFARLMTEHLGYEKFYAAGGDVGSGVVKALASKYEDKVAGVHLTDVGYEYIREDPSTMTEEEQQFAGFVQQWWFTEGAYAMIQMTKPQSLAYGLNDSPAGLAAWIINFGTAGAPPEILEQAFGGRDELLTNIMIYWVTQTIASSMRMYKRDAYASYAGTPPLKKSAVPAGISLFPREAQFPREYAERSVQVAYYERMSEGGHFAALEVPEVFSSELKHFFYGLTF